MTSVANVARCAGGFFRWPESRALRLAWDRRLKSGFGSESSGGNVIKGAVYGFRKTVNWSEFFFHQKEKSDARPPVERKSVRMFFGGAWGNLLRRQKSCRVLHSYILKNLLLRAVRRAIAAAPLRAQNGRFLVSHVTPSLPQYLSKCHTLGICLSNGYNAAFLMIARKTDQNCICLK
jgi:hypothetical protein